MLHRQPGLDLSGRDLITGRWPVTGVNDGEKIKRGTMSIVPRCEHGLSGN
jgi:hypothetical protein